jgi:hypothetical protein
MGLHVGVSICLAAERWEKKIPGEAPNYMQPREISDGFSVPSHGAFSVRHQRRGCAAMRRVP